MGVVIVERPHERGARAGPRVRATARSAGVLGDGSGGPPLRAPTPPRTELFARMLRMCGGVGIDVRD